MIRAAAPRRWRPGQTSDQAIRLPLAALQMRLETGSSTAHWSIDPDGISGRALVQHAGEPVTFPIRLGAPVELRWQVRLLPHDWRDGRGSLRAWVAVLLPGGRRRELWSRVLRTASEQRGRDEGRRGACRLPRETVALQLGVTGEWVSRVLWVEPELADPSAGTLPDQERDEAGSQGERHAERQGEDAASLQPSPASFSPTGGPPLISVLVPVHDPPAWMITEAIESVLSQTFGGWELCLVDDGSTDGEVVRTLERYAAADPRIRLESRDRAGGISVATNAALEMAVGEYVALLDHDDALTPDALQRVADRIAQDPGLDLVYSDETVVDDGGGVATSLKPGWSPDTLAALMYTNHLGVYRRRLALELGGFRPEFDGCQDYDLVLRLTERSDRVGHIPHSLYRWRAHGGSTAGGGQAKPYAYLAQPRAIAEHLERTGVVANVQYGPLPGVHRIVHRVDPASSVALVLAATTAEGLAEAAASIVDQPHPAWEVVIAAPVDMLAACAAAARAGGVPEARLTAVPGGSDAGAALAAAAAAASDRSEHLLLMPTPAAGLTRDWITRLIGYSAQAGVGAAAPVVLAADGRIRHAGVALSNGIPLALLHGSEPAAAPAAAMNVTAAGEVLCTRRAAYEQLGGLRTELGRLALVDYCLRAGQAGLRTVIVPDVRLRVSGVDDTLNDLPGLWTLRRRWRAHHSVDPYYNPNYRTDRGDFTPRPEIRDRSSS